MSQSRDPRQSGDPGWTPPPPPQMGRPRPANPAPPPAQSSTKVDPLVPPPPPPRAAAGSSTQADPSMARFSAPPPPANNFAPPPPPPGVVRPAGMPGAPLPPPPMGGSAMGLGSNRAGAAPAARSAASAGHPTLRQLVQEAFDRKFSDIHIGVGEAPRFRDRGEMAVTTYPVTTNEVFYEWLRESLPESQIREFEERMELDTAVMYEGLVRCRVNVFVSLKGPAIVMRLIPINVLTLEQLRCPPVLKTISEEHKGLVLVTGPTGSGKSTTMAAMVDYINSNFPKHIISIEDPIEFVHSSKKSMIRQREVGIHTLEFGNALKASLREDPDVLLIGEMRDRETVDTAIKAAQTGHLVFGTLHTNSAVRTIERLLGIYHPEEQEPMRMQLAETLVAVVAQTLVRTTDSKRTAAHEILRNTDAVRDYIRRGDLDEIEALIPQCHFDGMQTMNEALFNLYQEGRISEETAIEASPRSNEMMMWMRGAR